MDEKVIQLPQEVIKNRAKKGEVKKTLTGARGKGEIVGAITPLQAPLEAAEMIYEAGGEVFTRGKATAVKLPKFPKP